MYNWLVTFLNYVMECVNFGFEGGNPDNQWTKFFSSQNQKKKFFFSFDLLSTWPTLTTNVRWCCETTYLQKTTYAYATKPWQTFRGRFDKFCQFSLFTCSMSKQMRERSQWLHSRVQKHSIVLFLVCLVKEMHCFYLKKKIFFYLLLPCCTRTGTHTQREEERETPGRNLLVCVKKKQTTHEFTRYMCNR